MYEFKRLEKYNLTPLQKYRIWEMLYKVENYIIEKLKEKSL